MTDLQEQAAILHARIRDLEAHCTSGPGSAAIAFRELKCALSAEPRSAKGALENQLWIVCVLPWFGLTDEAFGDKE